MTTLSPRQAVSIPPIGADDPLGEGEDSGDSVAVGCGKAVAVAVGSPGSDGVGAIVGLVDSVGSIDGEGEGLWVGIGEMGQTSPPFLLVAFIIRKSP